MRRRLRREGGTVERVERKDLEESTLERSRVRLVVGFELYVVCVCDIFVGEEGEAVCVRVIKVAVFFPLGP